MLIHDTLFLKISINLYHYEMNNTAIDQWIRRFQKQDPPRSKSLLMTVFGDAIAPRGGTVWLGSLIALMAALGINDRLVRTSVFRLTEEGWLHASRSGRRSQYALTAQGSKRFARAHQRIYAPARTAWDGRWLFVFTSPATLGTSQRNMLKKELLWEGFGLIAPGLFAHPGHKIDALTDILARTGCADQVFVTASTGIEHIGTKTLTDLIHLCWQLHDVRKAYVKFTARFAPLLALLKEEKQLTEQQAFVIRTLLIHAFRRVQLHDPELPEELMPAHWPGVTAYELCRSIYVLVSTQANRFVSHALAIEQDSVPPLDTAFTNRFFDGTLKKRAMK